MLVTNRFVVDVDAADGFTERAHAALTALAAQSVDEPSAYEALASAAPGGAVVVAESDRAAGPYR